jgi:hypothetical protein
MMLATILSKLIDAAISDPAKPHGHRFTGGLRVTTIYHEKFHQINLVLSRDSVLPSFQEWKTVLNNWPYPVRAKPNPGDVNGRHYLAAMLPVHPKLF